MRSIKARFNQQEKITPNAGAYINLQRAIRGQRFLYSKLVEAFSELIPKEDYLRSEKPKLLEWLDIQNTRPRKSAHTK